MGEDDQNVDAEMVEGLGMTGGTLEDLLGPSLGFDPEGQMDDAPEQGQPVDALLKEARVWGARQSLFKRALPRIKESTANAALEDAARIDRMIKGIGGGDGWTEFLRLGLGLAGL